MTDLHSLANLWNMPTVSDIVPGSIILLYGWLAYLVSLLVWSELFCVGGSLLPDLRDILLSGCFLYSSHCFFKYPVLFSPFSLHSIHLADFIHSNGLAIISMLPTPKFIIPILNFFLSSIYVNADCTLDGFFNLDFEFNIFKSKFIIFFFF